jgi:hypothetical protein
VTSKVSADPFGLTAEQLRPLLLADAPLLPELEAIRGRPDSLRALPAAPFVLAQTEPLLAGCAEIPRTRYTDYRRFQSTGDRQRFEAAYFGRRANLAAAAFHLFLGQTELKEIVQDYLWSICEESDWVVPAHETGSIIDLFAAETGFELAEVLHLLGDSLDAEVRSRVRGEIERRIFTPYLRTCWAHHWYQGNENWNGVCNSSVAAAFLLLEPEPGRVARALELALAGLAVYLATAFEEDGSSTEGVLYWHYGLINFVTLAEMLRARSRGAIDLLASQRMQRIAAYPAKMRLSASEFASFSDSDAAIDLHPGVIARLAERTGERSVLALLPRHGQGPLTDWRLSRLLRDLLWWDGRRGETVPIDDAVLPAGGVARLTGRAAGGSPVVLAVKAGHNDENHNQNDVGSFILHVDGETLLTDPGRGLYTRFYFSDRRYENLFANSYGHSVPRIGGQLQAPGRDFRGELADVASVDDPIAAKQVTVEFARTYPVPGLERVNRRLLLATDGKHAGTVWLHDRFRFAGTPEEVEEALVTWLDAEVAGATAVVHGQRHTLRLTIERPAGALFDLERLEEQCRANAKPGVLTRLRFTLPVAATAEASVRMEIVSSTATTATNR